LPDCQYGLSLFLGKFGSVCLQLFTDVSFPPRPYHFYFTINQRLDNLIYLYKYTITLFIWVILEGLREIKRKVGSWGRHLFNIQHILVRKLKFAKTIKINKNYSNVIKFVLFKNWLSAKEHKSVFVPSRAGVLGKGFWIGMGSMTTHSSPVHITTQLGSRSSACDLHWNLGVFLIHSTWVHGKLLNGLIQG